MRHPCIVCDDVGYITDGRCLILCNCQASSNTPIFDMPQNPNADIPAPSKNASPCMSTNPNSAIGSPPSTRNTMTMAPTNRISSPSREDSVHG